MTSKTPKPWPTPGPSTTTTKPGRSTTHMAEKALREVARNNGRVDGGRTWVGNGTIGRSKR